MSGLLVDPWQSSCQDELSIFLKILECFSYTFTHKIHHKMPRNAAEATNPFCNCPSHLQISRVCVRGHRVYVHT